MVNMLRNHSYSYDNFCCPFSSVPPLQALFMPYDHKNSTPDGLPMQRMRSLLEEVKHLHCQERCMIGSGGGSVGSVDFYLNLMWMMQIFKRPSPKCLYFINVPVIYLGCQKKKTLLCLKLVQQG